MLQDELREPPLVFPVAMRDLLQPICNATADPFTGWIQIITVRDEQLSPRYENQRAQGARFVACMVDLGTPEQRRAVQ